MEEVINICSTTFDPADSYGRIASELATHLSPLTAINRLSLGEDNAPNAVFHPAVGGILLGYPTLHERFGGMVNAGPKIAITMFESTKLPEGWVEALNTCDAVIVPATFLVDIFKQAGVTAPLHVVPLGVSAEFMHYTPRTTPTGDEPFTFITIGDRGRRKGWVEACTAFVRAFGDSPDVKLIIKTRKPLPFGITNSNIQVVTGDMTNAELAELYTTAQVMVCPTHCEGYGLLPREFVATGGLAFVTNWGGTADKLITWGFPIPYTLESAWEGEEKWYGKLGEWAKPDVEALAHQMRDIEAHYDQYASLRRLFSSFMHRQTWSVFADHVFAIWSKVLETKYARHSD